MGCRQSKQFNGPHELPLSSSEWLTALGLQQYSAAFFAAGYGDIETLSGLSRKHVNEIALFQKGGIPSAHIKLLLEASKDFSSRQLAHSQQPLAAPHSSVLKDQSAVANQSQVYVHTAPTHSIQHQPDLRLSSVGRLHQARLANTASSYTSATSFDSGYDTDDVSTQASLDSTAELLTSIDKHTSTGPSLNATANLSADSQASSETVHGSAAREDGPSQQQLQQLYNAMQDDYKRLQQLHPASGRLHASKQPVASVRSQADKAIPSNAAQLPSAAAACYAVARMLPAQQHQQLKAGTKAPQQRHPHQQQVSSVCQQQRSTVASDATAAPALGAARPTALQVKINGPHVQGLLEVGSGRVTSGSAAAHMVKQMRKRKTAMQEEPFVHVYTNFHTISKEGHVPDQAEASVNESDPLPSDQACTGTQPPEEQLQHANHTNSSKGRGLLQSVQQENTVVLQAPAPGQEHGSCVYQHLHPKLNAETNFVQQQQQNYDTAIDAQQLQQQQPFSAARDAQLPQHGHAAPFQQSVDSQQQVQSLWPTSQQQKPLLLSTPQQQQQQAAYQQEGSNNRIAAVHCQSAAAWGRPLQGVDLRNQQAAPQYSVSHPDDDAAIKAAAGGGKNPIPFSPDQDKYPQRPHIGASNASQHAKQPMQQVLQQSSLPSQSAAPMHQLALPVAQPMMQQPNPYPPPNYPSPQQPASSVTQQAWSLTSSMTYQPHSGPAQHQSHTHQAASVSQQYQNQPEAVMQRSVHSQNSWQSQQAPSRDGSGRDELNGVPASGYGFSGRQQQHFAQQRVQRDAQGNSTSVTYSRSSSSHEFSFKTSRPQSNMLLPGDANIAPQAEGAAASAAAVEALRVIKMAKLHRHGPPSRLMMPGQHHMVQQQMQQMDAQIRQRVQYLQQRAI